MDQKDNMRHGFSDILLASHPWSLNFSLPIACQINKILDGFIDGFPKVSPSG